MIADEGSGCVGDAGGKACLTDVLHHSFDRKIGKIGRSTVLIDRQIDRLVAFVVFDTGIVEIDGYAFRGDVVASAGLADAEHCVWFLFCNGSSYGSDGFAEDGRNLKLYHLYVSDFFRDQLYGFQSRIDFVSAKGIKCG